MQSVTPTSQYLKALNEGSHQPDDVQKEAVSRLEIIYQELINSTPPAPRTSGLMARVGKLWGKREDTKHTPVRGLYMWGGVGRGKTWLMDLFYQSLPGERKQRLHFPKKALPLPQSPQPRAPVVSAVLSAAAYSACSAAETS